MGTGAMERAVDSRPGFHTEGLSSRLSARPWTLLSSRTLRARAWNGQSLWPSLQSTVFQRRLPRRTSSASGRRLAAIAGASRIRHNYQPMAGRVSLDRITESVLTGALG